MSVNPQRTDVLAVGAGPAGMAAAIAAATHGSKVLVLDDNASEGGQIWRRGLVTPHDPARPHVQDATQAALRTAFHQSGAELLPGRRVVDAPRPGILHTIANSPAGPVLESFAWDRLILATGARERFLPFPGWTLPGVIGAGGLQALVKGGYPVEGKRVIVAGTGPLLLAVAAHLRRYGANILSVVEQASLSQLAPFAASLWSHPAKVKQGIRYRAALANVPYRTGWWPVAVEQDPSGILVRLTNGKRTLTLACDLLACGFHLVPNTELAELLGCELQGDVVAVNEQQQTSVAGIFCAGEPTGIAGLDAALVQGEIAGLAAAGQTQQSSFLRRRRAKENAFGQRLNTAFRLRPEVCSLSQPETVVCRCEDVNFARLQGHASWTEAKLQTRCGMGPCQGRICGPAVQSLFGWRSISVRPPIFPVPISAFVNNDSNSLEKLLAFQETP
jgi:NADPH-dependent 2,4-dienoyl-CoA reductase/sulfur reductase-like enzyme